MQLHSGGTVLKGTAAQKAIGMPKKHQRPCKRSLFVSDRTIISQIVADDGRVPAEADVRYRRCGKRLHYLPI